MENKIIRMIKIVSKIMSKSKKARKKKKIKHNKKGPSQKGKCLKDKMHLKKMIEIILLYIICKN